jgi:hypothetical protein
MSGAVKWGQGTLLQGTVILQQIDENEENSLAIRAASECVCPI